MAAVEDPPAVTPSSGAWRPALGWFAVAVAAWVFGGPTAGVAAVVLAGWHLARPPGPRVLLGLAVVAFGLVPAAWLVGNLDRLGLASPRVVLDNRTPSTVAVVALLLLVVGVHRDTTRPRSTGTDPVTDPDGDPEPDPDADPEDDPEDRA
jgi:hypothetical protein